MPNGNNKLVYQILTGVFALLLTVLGYVWMTAEQHDYNQDERISDVRADLSGDLRIIQMQVVSVDKTVAKIEERVQFIYEDITGIEEIKDMVTRLEERLVSLDKKVSRLEDKIARLEEKVARLKSLIGH